MKSTLCGECGSIKKKTVEQRVIGSDGWRITKEMDATEETPEHYEIIEVWCPNCGIMFKPGV